MGTASIREGVRRMRFSMLLDRQERGEITQDEAAEVLGISVRSFQRWTGRFTANSEAGLADRRLGRRSPRRALAGMMLHQDGSRHVWLEGHPAMDLIVTLDDATSEIYLAFLVEEEGTASTFRALRESVEERGLFCALYTDRGSHYFHTPKAGEKVSRTHLTQVGRALAHLGIEHIAAYSPEARGRSERAFGTLQDRLPKELRLAGIRTVEAANAWLRGHYIAAHNAAFALQPEQEGSAFADRGEAWREALCVVEERTVANDNTIGWEGRRLQLPESRLRPHFVKAQVRVHAYPDGALAVFLGPHRLADYDAAGTLTAPAATSLASCSSASRAGLAAAELVGRPARPPPPTRPARVARPNERAGTEKRASSQTKKRAPSAAASAAATA